MSDDSDINRELKCLFVRANLLCRRFRRCTLQVKLKLFRAFCIFASMTLLYGVTILLACCLNLLPVTTNVQNFFLGTINTLA